MFKTARRKLVAALLLTPLMVGSAMAQGKGLITIIVNDPANPYWLTEGNVAKATAEKWATPPPWLPTPVIPTTKAS